MDDTLKKLFNASIMYKSDWSIKHCIIITIAPPSLILFPTKEHVFLCITTLLEDWK